jgi:hypothetical protein
MEARLRYKESVETISSGKLSAVHSHAIFDGLEVLLRRVRAVFRFSPSHEALDNATVG